MRINIREALNNLDKDTCNEYGLLGLYESCNLSDDSKKAIVKLISENKSARVIYKYMSRLDECKGCVPSKCDGDDCYDDTKQESMTTDELSRLADLGSKCGIKTFDDLQVAKKHYNTNSAFEAVLKALIDYNNHNDDGGYVGNEFGATFESLNKEPTLKEDVMSFDKAKAIAKKKLGIDLSEDTYDAVVGILNNVCDDCGETVDTESKPLKEASGSDWEYFNKFDAVVDEYLPQRGEGSTIANQIVTAVNKLVYKFFNDGDVYDNRHGLEGWNDLSSYANWLYKYVPETQYTLDIINEKDYISEDGYVEILQLLADLTLTDKFLEPYAHQDKQGSIYKCDGPFKCVDDPNNEDDDDYDYDDDDYDYDDDGETYGESLKEDSDIEHEYSNKTPDGKTGLVRKAVSIEEVEEWGSRLKGSLYIAEDEVQLDRDLKGREGMDELDEIVANSNVKGGQYNGVYSVIKVTTPSRVFLIDPEGYSYARYVGIDDVYDRYYKEYNDELPFESLKEGDDATTLYTAFNGTKEEANELANEHNLTVVSYEEPTKQGSAYIRLKGNRKDLTNFIRSNSTVMESVRNN